MRLKLAAVAIALLGLGALLAWQVDAALGISFRPADVPVEHPAAAPAQPVAAAPAIPEIAIPDERQLQSVPPDDGQNQAARRIRLAADAVASALVDRGAPRPAIRTGGSAALQVVLTQGMSGEAFRVRHDGGLVVEATTPAGAAAGLYTIADRIRSGDDVLKPGDEGRVIAPRLGLRLIDAGAVGIDADPAGFVNSDDYSLNTDVVGDAVLPGPPYVDTAAVDRISAQFRQLVDHALTLGYNGIVLPGFLEYVTFKGLAVYPAGDPHVARAEAMVQHFGPVWQYAHDMGMKVYFGTDMLALSPPLKAYLNGRSTEDPQLWTVYQAGLRELFTSLPYADGLMIRIGEGGRSYKFAGWDYTSEIAVTTAPAVRAMLRAFLDVGRDIIFRTWSIGQGAVGDMHTNPASYEEVLGGIDDPHLIVSTKYCLGDYYSYLPFNTTLETGKQRRIVEFQARREFEAFGSLPNDLGPLHQAALRRFLAANPHIEGVWNWTQIGGPVRAGPRTLYLRAGFWQLFELDTYVTARLAWNPDTDVAAVTADWARQTFSTDPSTVEAIGRAMALSRQAVTKGLYIAPYASRTVKALGLEPPPMMWIFEWDIVTGDSAVLDSIYAVSKDRLDEAIRDGDEATDLSRRMRTLIADTAPATWRDPALRQHFLDTLDYQVNLFETLSAYRTMVLRYAQWLDTGAPTARTAWEQARSGYTAARTEHLRRYTGNVDLPPYRFPAADLGLTRADRDLPMAWLARALLAALAALLALGSAPGQRLLHAPLPGSAALRALWLGATRPWRLRDLAPPPTRADRMLIWALPTAILVLSRAIYTWFASPVHLILVLGAWLLFAASLQFLRARTDPFHLWAALGGVVLLRTTLLLVTLVLRGPGRYWFHFWTDPPSRFAYITVAFAAFLWLFVVAYLTLRASGLSRRQTTGRVLTAAALPILAFGALLTATGLERALTAWNDEMALLPWGLSRILGITVFLDIPQSLPRLVTITGAVLVALGAALAAIPTRKRR